MNRLPQHRTPSTQHGFSLLELSILVVLLGIGAVTLWQLSNLNQQQELPERQKTLLLRADQALTGYVFSQQRLPCPAENPASGVEQCSGNLATGYLPFKTLGLPDKEAGRIRYGVLRRSSQTDDADLTQRKARLQVLHFNPGNATTSLAKPSPNSDTQAHARESGVFAKDFCSALSSASSLPFSADFVHIDTPGLPSTSKRNVAYALALPKQTRQTSGQKVAPPSLTFNSPIGNRLSTQQDAVLAVSPQSLSSKLSCPILISAVRSYANIQTAAAIHTRTMPDYLNQLDINLAKANATLSASKVGELRALAGLLDAEAGVIKAISGLTGATPDDIVQKKYKIFLAKWSRVNATLAFQTMSIGLPLAADQSYQRAKKNYDRVKDVLLPQTNALKLAIDERMARTLNAGIYLPISTPAKK